MKIPVLIIALTCLSGCATVPQSTVNAAVATCRAAAFAELKEPDTAKYKVTVKTRSRQVEVHIARAPEPVENGVVKIYLIGRTFICDMSGTIVAQKRTH